MLKLSPKRIVRLFLVSLILSVVGVVTFVHLSPRKASYGYLVRHETGKYLLAWKPTNPDEVYELELYDTLELAMHEANQTFGMTMGHWRALPELERVWMEDRNGKTIVFWKVFSVKNLFRSAFDKASEADAFASAIARGAYSPSPFGHALYFLSPPALPVSHR